jgi:tRNA-intron endonuclease, archaea type
MSDNTKASSIEFKTFGVITDQGVKVLEQRSIDALSNRGYGILENKELTLAFFEAMYLADKGMLEAKTSSGEIVDFQMLLHNYETINENAWVNYLVYRDLRGRGYVVRDGFGVGTDFRVYERGAYGKSAASFLVLGIQEGKPLPIDMLANVLQQSQSQKKELIIAVINRRGEIVYYSVSQLTFT